MGLGSTLKQNVGQLASDKLEKYPLQVSIHLYERKLREQPNLTNEEIRCEQLQTLLFTGLIKPAEKVELGELCDKYPTDNNKNIKEYIDFYPLRPLSNEIIWRERQVMLGEIAKINQSLGVVSDELNQTMLQEEVENNTRKALALWNVGASNVPDKTDPTPPPAKDDSSKDTGHDKIKKTIQPLSKETQTALSNYYDWVLLFNGSPNKKQVRCAELVTLSSVGLVTSAEKEEMNKLYKEYPTDFNQTLSSLNKIPLKDLNDPRNRETRQDMSERIMEYNADFGIGTSKIVQKASPEEAALDQYKNKLESLLREGEPHKNQIECIKLQTLHSMHLATYSEYKRLRELTKSKLANVVFNLATKPLLIEFTSLSDPHNRKVREHMLTQMEIIDANHGIKSDKIRRTVLSEKSENATRPPLTEWDVAAAGNVPNKTKPTKTPEKDCGPKTKDTPELKK